MKYKSCLLSSTAIVTLMLISSPLKASRNFLEDQEVSLSKVVYKTEKNKITISNKGDNVVFSVTDEQNTRELSPINISKSLRPLTVEQIDKNLNAGNKLILRKEGGEDLVDLQYFLKGGGGKQSKPKSQEELADEKSDDDVRTSILEGDYVKAYRRIVDRTHLYFKIERTLSKKISQGSNQGQIEVSLKSDDTIAMSWKFFNTPLQEVKLYKSVDPESNLSKQYFALTEIEEKLRKQTITKMIDNSDNRMLDDK